MRKRRRKLHVVGAFYLPGVDRVGLETCVGAAQLAWLEKMLVKWWLFICANRKIGQLI